MLDTRDISDGLEKTEAIPSDEYTIAVNNANDTSGSEERAAVFSNRAEIAGNSANNTLGLENPIAVSSNASNGYKMAEAKADDTLGKKLLSPTEPSIQDTDTATPTRVKGPRRPVRSNPPRRRTIQPLPTPGLRKTAAEQQMQEAAAERAHQKRLMDSGIARVTNEYMEESGGDLEKAAGLWIEREERKSQQPWPVLREYEAAVEAMKKDILDPKRIQQQIEETGEGKASKLRRSGFSRRVSTRDVREAQKPVNLTLGERELPIAQMETSIYPNPALGIKNKPLERPDGLQKDALPTPQIRTSTAELENRSAERLELQRDKLSQDPTGTLMERALALEAPEASDKQLATSASPQELAVLSTQKASPLSSSLREIETHVRKKRRRADQDLELGARWTASFTNDGHRPCVRPRSAGKK
ncbi:hypothetical protein ANO14919_051360 [Xylariales sp. No.14919]|nr:hypothetical protein ANO14919_051360 [Xylariales sp. No.14919]